MEAQEALALTPESASKRLAAMEKVYEAAIQYRGVMTAERTTRIDAKRKLIAAVEEAGK